MDAESLKLGFLFTMFIIVVLILTIFIFIINQVRKKTANCNINKVLKTPFPKLTSIDPSIPDYNYNLRDYYIKSSYNSCAGGQFENDWVGTCSLVAVIRQGCRLLDFEIYNMDGVAAVAVSPTKNYYEKGSYNYITFDEAMEVVSFNAFAGSSCPNPNDPLFINIRIQSNDILIYDSVSESLAKHLENKMLGNEFSHEYNGNNLGKIPISRLLGKVCVIVDKTNPLVETTKLDDFVNIAGNSIYLRNLRFHEVIYTNDMEELKNFNKQYMTISSPNKSKLAENYNAVITMQYGVQFNSMCFQTQDVKLAAYKQLFEDKGHAFILKPLKLRYVEGEPTPLVDPQPFGFNRHTASDGTTYDV